MRTSIGRGLQPTLWSLFWKSEPRYFPADGGHLLALDRQRVQIFDTEDGRLLTDREFRDSVVRWEESLGLILVRNASGTTAYRRVPLEGVTPDALLVVEPWRAR